MKTVGVSRMPVSPQVWYFCVPTSTEKSQLEWLGCFAHCVRISIWIKPLLLNQYYVS